MHFTGMGFFFWGRRRKDKHSTTVPAVRCYSSAAAWQQHQGAAAYAADRLRGIHFHPAAHKAIVMLFNCRLRYKKRNPILTMFMVYGPQLGIVRQ